MGGLLLILPILVFDLWLIGTTGRRQMGRWLAARQGWRVAGAAAAGLAIAVWLTFFIRYGFGPKTRVQGFPLPLLFFHLEEKTWTTAPLQYWGGTADFLSGLAAPFIPFKVNEFLQQVKAELK